MAELPTSSDLVAKNITELPSFSNKIDFDIRQNKIVIETDK